MARRAQQRRLYGFPPPQNTTRPPRIYMEVMIIFITILNALMIGLLLYRGLPGMGPEAVDWNTATACICTALVAVIWAVTAAKSQLNR